MSEAVAPVIATGRLLATRTVQKEGRDTTTAVFNDALLEWETNRASIAARLLSYFDNASSGGEPLPQAWDEYSERVEDLYYLSTTGYVERCRSATALKRYLKNQSLSCRKFRADGSLLEGQVCKGEEQRPRRDRDNWKIVALCDRDSKEDDSYERGQGFFNAYKAISKDLLRRERRLLDAVRTTTPAGF
jgi:hypothetical protein